MRHYEQEMNIFGLDEGGLRPPQVGVQHGIRLCATDQHLGIGEGSNAISCQLWSGFGASK